MNPRIAPPLRLDPPVLAVIAEELQERLAGRLLGRACSAEGFPEDLLLFFPEIAPDERRDLVLRIALDPGRARLHLDSRPAPAREQGPLVRALSQRLGGRVLLSLSSVTGERAVRLALGPGPEEADPASLVLELFPPGTWLLLDRDDRVLLAGRKAAGGRSFAPGASWRLPPPRAEVGQRPWPAGLPRERLGAFIEERFAAYERELRTEAEAHLRQAALARALAKALGRVKALEAQAAEGGEAQAMRRRGELLKANLHRIRQGQPFLEVEDFFDPGLPLVRIALDPGRGAREVMEALFHKARRLERGRAQVAARLAEARGLAALAQDAAAALAAGRPWDDLAAGLEPLRRERLLVLPAPPSAPDPRGAQAGRAGPEAQFRRFLSREGMTILVGRDRRQNDQLTLRVARGNDLWLHAGGGVGGSHVVVRVPRGKVASPETLLDAAHLALHYSQARGRPRAEVLWTQRKWVRKPKGLAPGQVRVDRSRTLLVEFDPELLARVLATAGGTEP